MKSTTTIQVQQAEASAEAIAIKHKPLTYKQKEFVQQLVENPKQPAYKAAEAAGYTGNNATLRAIASENLTKPNILQELEKHSNTAEIALIKLLNTSLEYSTKGNTAGASYTATGASIANSILDRLHGKATQRLETTSQAVTLNIDLTGVVQ